jgi:hypothetical protein
MAFHDCPGWKRAVVFDEIAPNLLRARKMAFSHQSSERRFMTARMRKRAVVFDEISFKLLLA